jgi:integrase
VKDGEPTSEVDSIRQALRPVRRLYAHTCAKDFGPLALRTVRDAMMEQGWARTYINRQVNRVKRMFRWAVSHQMLAESVYTALCTVDGLRKGRTPARETAPVTPVSDDVVEATIRHLRPMVASMVRLQRRTGARPQQIVGMHANDIDFTDPECWVYRPRRHKTSHLDKERTIFLGPRAQSILKQYPIPGHDGHLFSPERSEADRNAEKRSSRKTPLWPSHVARRDKSPSVQRTRPPRDRFDVASYRRAIARACDKAFPHPTLGKIPAKELNDDQRAELNAWQKAHRWHPHQLRHSAATEIRKDYGLEGAQVSLGHSELGTTQLYAERDLATARRIAIEIG